MKKVIVPYIAGAATVLVASYVTDVISQSHTTESFGRWVENERDVVKSTFVTKDWLLIELENNDEANRNLTSSRYGMRKVFLKPKDQNSAYILCIEQGESEPEKIWIGDDEGKQVVVPMSDGSLSGAQIFGSEFLTIDKDMDGTIDSQRKIRTNKSEKETTS